MKYYLLSVCLLYPLSILAGIISGILFPGTQLQLPLPLSKGLQLYIVIGIVVLLVDLWRSKRTTDDDKLWWTVVLFFFGFLLAPLYWFMVIDKKQPAQPLPSPEQPPR